MGYGDLDEEALKLEIFRAEERIKSLEEDLDRVFKDLEKIYIIQEKLRGCLEAGFDGRP